MRVGGLVDAVERSDELEGMKSSSRKFDAYDFLGFRVGYPGIYVRGSSVVSLVSPRGPMEGVGALRRGSPPKPSKACSFSKVTNRYLAMNLLPP